jgi:hypothetical protein
MPLAEKWRAIAVVGNGVLKHTRERFQYRLGFVTGEEAAALVRLQGQILSVAPKPLPLYVRDQKYFVECAEECGCIVGAWHDDRLIAYSVLQVPPESEENYGALMGIPADELHCVGHAAGSGVHPDYRRNSLHKSMIVLRNDFALDNGYVHLCGEVLPTNVASIRNHLAGGFFLKGLKVDKFDLDAYLLHKDLRVAPQLTDEPTKEWDINDVEWYRRMLDDGFWGFRLSKRGDWLLNCGRFS